ncbi:MAG TPA: Tad domain-containing protein [Dehalococcoidia bacterium]
MNHLKRLHRKQGGQMLVMAGISLVVVVGFAALAIDVGLWLHQRTKLQADADAMALAGAQLLCGSGTCQTEVEDLARSYGPKNSIQNVEIEFVRTSSDCGGNPNPIGLQPHQYVAVEVKRTQPTFLASVLGITNTEIRACAVAAKYGLGGTPGVRPFALEQKCIDGTVGPLIVYGDVVTLKFDTEGKGTCATSQGNFASLAIDGTGASVYQTTIEKGSTSPLCTDTTPGCCPTAGATGCIGTYGVYKVDTETGNIISANRDGIQYLLDHTPTSCDTWDEVQVNGNITPDCAPWTPGYVGGTNTRILIVPIVTGLWDSGGNNTVTIKRFAVVFLEGWDTKNGKCTGSSCDIQARFIESIVSLPNATLVPFTCTSGICPDLTVAKIVQ